ncbi:hypothetical protein, partial [Alistipes putredinis]|uniref:hypothetical protein n=1 Tax=Alistipes putredinis TaxID=28117 RepID=UPI0026714C52
AGFKCLTFSAVNFYRSIEGEDSSGPHKAPNRRITPARFIVIRKKYGAGNTSCYARSECSRPNRLFLR